MFARRYTGIFYMRKLLFACILLFANVATADPYLYLGQWSNHFHDDGDEYNEKHDLIGVEYRSWFVGTYKNSFRDESWLLTKRFSKSVCPHFDYGAKVGFVTGYDHLWNVGGAAPILLIDANVMLGDTALNFNYGFAFVSVGMRYAF